MKNKIEDKCPLLQNVRYTEKESFLKYANNNLNIIKNNKKSIIIQKDKLNLYYVLNGSYLESVIDNKDKISYSLIFGKNSLFSDIGFKNFETEWHSLEDNSKVLTISKNQRDYIIFNYPKVTQNIIRLQDELASNYQNRLIKNMNDLTLEDKLHNVIDTCITQIGREEKDYFTMKKLDQKTLAKMIGTTRESVSRTIKNSNSISYGNSRIKVKKRLHEKWKKY